MEKNERQQYLRDVKATLELKLSRKSGQLCWSDHTGRKSPSYDEVRWSQYRKQGKQLNPIPRNLAT